MRGIVFISGGGDVCFQLSQLRGVLSGVRNWVHSTVRPLRRSILDARQFTQSVERVRASGKTVYTSRDDNTIGGGMGTSSFGMSSIPRRFCDPIWHTVGQ